MLSQLTSLLGLTPASRGPNTQTGEEPTIDFASVFARAEDEQPSWHLDSGPIAETEEGEEAEEVLLSGAESDDAVDVDHLGPQSAEADEGDVPLTSGLDRTEDSDWFDEGVRFQNKLDPRLEMRGHDAPVAILYATVPPDNPVLTRTTSSRVSVDGGAFATVRLKESVDVKEDAPRVISESDDMTAARRKDSGFVPAATATALPVDPSIGLPRGLTTDPAFYARQTADLSNQPNPTDPALNSRAPLDIGEDVRKVTRVPRGAPVQRELPVFRLDMSAADRFPQQFSCTDAPLTAPQRSTAPPIDGLVGQRAMESVASGSPASTDGLIDLDAPISQGETPDETAPNPPADTTPRVAKAGPGPIFERQAGSFQLSPDRGRTVPVTTTVKDPQSAFPRDAIETRRARAGTIVVPTTVAPAPAIKVAPPSDLGVLIAPEFIQPTSEGVDSLEVVEKSVVAAVKIPQAAAENFVSGSLSKPGAMISSDISEKVSVSIADHQSAKTRIDDRHFRFAKSAGEDGIAIDRAHQTPSTDRKDFHAGPVGLPALGKPGLGDARVTSPMLADFLDESLSAELRGTGAAADLRTPSVQLPPTTSISYRADAMATVRQVAEGMARLSEGSVEIRLSPEELGQVRMQLVPSESGMTVHVSADRPETLDLLRRHIDQLARDLADAGYDGASFTFSDGGEGRRDGQPTPDGDDALVGQEDQRATRTSVAPAAPDGLDLRF